MRTWKHSLGVCAVLACAIAGRARAEESWINWLTDYKEGLRQAQETHKPLLVEFGCEA